MILQSRFLRHSLCQFQGLITPSNQFSRRQINRPIVIVIDALDEGCDTETVSVLRNQVLKLPGTFTPIA